MPTIIFSVVVLPEPFGPMSPYISPGLMASERPSTAFVEPNVLATDFNSRAAFFIRFLSIPRLFTPRPESRLRNGLDNGLRRVSGGVYDGDRRTRIMGKYTKM